MVSRASVNNRVGAARIVANHSTNHRTIGGRSFRAEQESELFKMPVEFVPNDSWLNGHRFFSFVDTNNVGEVF